MSALPPPFDAFLAEAARHGRGALQFSNARIGMAFAIVPAAVSLVWLRDRLSRWLWLTAWAIAATAIAGTFLAFVEYMIGRQFVPDWMLLRGNASNAFVAPQLALPFALALLLIGLSMLLRDQRRTEIALRRSEERYRTIADNLPHYIFGIDAQNRYTAANAALCRWYGLEEREIVGHTTAELGVSPETTALWNERNAKAFATGQTLTTNVETQFAGEVRHIQSLVAPVRDESGSIVALTGISRDVTREKAADAEIRRLMRAVEDMNDVMFTTDRAGRITYVNPAFERVYGFSREEALGQTPRILKSGNRTTEWYEQFWSEILAGRSVRTEYENRAKNGELVCVIASVSPIRSESGEITGFLTVQQDVTAQRAMEREALRLNARVAHLATMEALGTMAGGMAHDFNNILSIILSHVVLVERRIDSRDRVLSSVDTIKRAVLRGTSLSREILTFARRTDARLEPMCIGELVRELASMIPESFPPNIEVSFDVAPALPRILGDAGQLHQALLNLCVNARDAMQDGGTLRICAHTVPGSAVPETVTGAESADYVCISVADTGCGMHEAVKRRIFEPFFTTKPKGKGTGLGLAVVYGVVSSHKAVIDVQSDPGRGTEFRLYFRAAADALSGTLHAHPGYAESDDEVVN